MSASAISDLYISGKFETVNAKVSADDGYKRLQKEYCEAHEALYAGLQQKEAELLDRLETIVSRMELESSAIHYAEGVKTGVRLGVECFLKE